MDWTYPFLVAVAAASAWILLTLVGAVMAVRSGFVTTAVLTFKIMTAKQPALAVRIGLAASVVIFMLGWTWTIPLRRLSEAIWYWKVARRTKRKADRERDAVLE